MLDPKVFKAYDVRGLYPGELDEEGAEGFRRGEAAREDRTSGHLAGIRRACSLLRRRLGDQAAARRDRRGERNGRCDAAADPGAAADRRIQVLLRAGRDLPEPRAES